MFRVQVLSIDRRVRDLNAASSGWVFEGFFDGIN